MLVGCVSHPSLGFLGVWCFQSALVQLGFVNTPIVLRAGNSYSHWEIEILGYEVARLWRRMAALQRLAPHRHKRTLHSSQLIFLG
jgi:hypothetical protein